MKIVEIGLIYLVTSLMFIIGYLKGTETGYNLGYDTAIAETILGQVNPIEYLKKRLKHAN